MRSRILLRSFPACLLWLVACLSPAGPAGGLPEGGTVLFVGNSLTYWNELPLLVQALAKEAGSPGIEARMVAFPDVDLRDHVARGDALTAIRRGGWTTVVLQQGPSTLPENRAQLRASTTLLAEEITKVGARPALFAVWPSAGRRMDFPAAHESYALAAADVGGLLFPVGEAWTAAWRRDPQLALYSADGLHPSPTGSYLAALVMTSALTGRSPVGMARTLHLANGARVEIGAAVAATLQAAAAEALAAAPAARGT